MDVSEQVINVLDVLSEKVGVAIDWTSDNIIPYAQELCAKYISYKLSIAIMCLVIGVVIGLLGLLFIKLIKYGIRYEEKHTYGYDDWGVTCGAIGTVGIITTTIASIWMIIHNTVTIIICLTFPEKLLIEYIQTLIQ